MLGEKCLEIVISSAADLFKYRQGLDKSIPQKGGDKDYMPDGSWLQERKLENVNIERHQVLSEPRVQRSGDLVKGEWNPERRLVEFQKEMRNFWEHMGFVDSKRKWLYPEEALFLMETNVLEVWYYGLPLSIYEGYMLFLDKSITLEYYQVFAHLRRIGYVVLRHQGRLKLTKYEQQIGLDKALSRRERKSLQRKQYAGKKSKEHSSSTVNFPEAQSNDFDYENNTAELVEEMEIDSDIHQTSSDVTGLDEQSNQSESRQEDRRKFPGKLDDRPDASGLDNYDKRSTHEEDADEGGFKLFVTKDRHSELPADSSKGINVELVNDESKIEAIKKAKQTSEVRYSSWNFNEIIFPDFGVDASVIVLEQPHKNQTPDNMETKCTKYQFERVSSINQKKEKKKNRKEETDTNENLKFSIRFMEADYKKGIKSCKNWQEYKMEVNRRRTGRKRKKDFPHLFANIEPLVKPELSVSTGAVLEQLDIIKEESSSSQSGQAPKTFPHFDVYKPDVKFRKSSPGIPDHRVVVAKCSDPMPELSDIRSITCYLGDEVPLNWAVVETGNIAFYSVTDFHLPLDITVG